MIVLTSPDSKKRLRAMNIQNGITIAEKFSGEIHSLGWSVKGVRPCSSLHQAPSHSNTKRGKIIDVFRTSRELGHSSNSIIRFFSNLLVIFVRPMLLQTSHTRAHSSPFHLRL